MADFKTFVEGVMNAPLLELQKVEQIVAEHERIMAEAQEKSVAAIDALTKALKETTADLVAKAEAEAS